MSEPDPVATRRALHAVAELVMAGPQHRRTGDIRLRQTPGGFATVTEPDLRIDGADLVAGSLRLPLSGTSIGALATDAGVDVGGPVDVYHTGSGAHPDDEINVDGAVAAHFAACYALGEAALRRLAPGETPVLWPEHFDLAINTEEINYGVSLGDDWLGEPYAYVGPFRPRAGAFWTAPFGAAVPMRQLPDVESLLSFLAEGRDRARRDPILDDRK